MPMRSVPPVAVPPPLGAAEPSPALGEDWGVVQAATSRPRAARMGSDRQRRIGLGCLRTGSYGAPAAGGRRISRARMAYATDSGQRFPASPRIPCILPLMPSGSPRATPRALVRAQVALESFSLSPDGSDVVYTLRRVRRDDLRVAPVAASVARRPPPAADPWPRPRRCAGHLAGRALPGLRADAVPGRGGGAPGLGHAARRRRAMAADEPEARRQRPARGAPTATGSRSSPGPATRASSWARSARAARPSLAGSRGSTSATTTPAMSIAAPTCG